MSDAEIEAYWTERSNAAEAQVRLLTEALRWIADPSYVGNYDEAQVVEIHRKWARAALASPVVAASESEETP